MNIDRESLFVLVAMTCSIASCGSDANDMASGSQLEPETDGGSECAPTTPTFATGMSGGLLAMDPKTGIEARIIEADYSPPLKGFNTWTIAVTDERGAPVPSANMVWACAWMPQHQHGTNPRAVTPEAGRFTISQQNLAMYGDWEVRYWIKTETTASPYMPQVSVNATTGDACTPTGVILGGANIVFRICVPRSRGGA